MTAETIKDALGVEVDSSTFDYSTDGQDITVSTDEQYTYFVTATLQGQMDGKGTNYETATPNQVLTLAKYNMPNPAWAGSFAFRTEDHYTGEIDGEEAEVYGFVTLAEGDISGTEGSYSAAVQNIGGLNVSDIKMYRVLKSALDEDTQITSEWFAGLDSDWKSENLLDVSQNYFATIKESSLAESLELNTDELAAEQIFNDVEMTVADTADSTVNGVTLNNQNYKVVVDDESEVSQYQGSALNEILTLKEGSVNVVDENSEVKGDKYESSADGKTYTVKTYALMGAGNDTVYGTKGNDWINGEAGDDLIYGGTNGHDMISGGDGNDVIIAGGIVTQKEATGADDGTELKDGYAKINGEYIKLNTTNSEFYGDNGNDTIYSGMGDDFIWAEAGNDVINLNGGKNTLLFTNVAWDSAGFGNDVVNGLSENDTLEFFVQNTKGTKFYGYALSDLTFGQSEFVGNKADLTITAGANSITIKDFYIKDDEGNIIPNEVNLNVLAQNGLTEHVSTSTVLAQYATDGKIYVDNVSDYEGVASLSEVVALKQADKALDEHEGFDGKTYQIFARADMSEGTAADEVMGSAANDMIIGGQGNDVLLGGSAGHDFIAGNAGNDIIIAGEQTLSDKDLEIEELDEFYAKINSTGSELYGGQGNDTIYSSKGDDIIAGNEGADNIILQGGTNTLLFSENNFGADTIVNATSKDVLQFTDGLEGYEKEDLTFAKSGNNDLQISATGGGSVTIKDFFKGSEVDTFIAENAQGLETKYSILKDAIIDMGTITTAQYTGSKYNEAITIGNTNTVITMGGSNNIINYNAADMGNSIINLTKGENLNLEFTGDVSTMDYSVDDNDNLILSLGGKTITINSYMTGKTGANVQINGYDMYDWDEISTSLAALASASTYTAIEAMENKGRVQGSDMSDYFNMTGYISESDKGVTIKSGAGDDRVVGSSYNDTVNIKSGNNTVIESEGVNKITTGAGNDQLISTGTASNTANLGDGNNDVTLTNTGVNKITTGKGNDNFDVEDGTNNIKVKEGNNVFDISGGSNNITTGKGNDYFELITSENIIKSGAGNDIFDIYGGVNKITTSGKKTDVAQINVYQGINNIKTGASNDVYEVTNGTNTIDSGAGNDYIELNNGSNTVKSGAGNDTLNIGGGVNIADTGAGDDIAIVDNGTNSIKLGAGKDTITLSGGDNIIDAGAGDDTIKLIGGTNTVLGGAGKDTYDLTEFNFADDAVISDSKGISTFKFANLTALDGLETSDGNTYSFFANVTLDNSKLGYSVNGYTITQDTVTDGAIAGRNANDIYVAMGKNKSVDITADTKTYSLDTATLASDVASWISNTSHSYASVDDLMQSGDADNINAFLTTFTISNYHTTAV